MSAKNVYLEKAQRYDAEILADICKRAFNSDAQFGAPKPEGGPPGYDDPEFHKKLMGWIDYYKIIHSNTIVGGISVRPYHKFHHELAQIFVDPDHHREGFGSCAMLQIEKKYSSAKMWTLGTPDWNTRTKAFYESVGYRQIGIEVTPEHDGRWFQKEMDSKDPYLLPKINEFRDGQRNVDVEGTIIEATTPKNVKTRDGRDVLVVNSVLSDETGSITLVQWDHQIKQACVNDRVRLENIQVRSYRGMLQISTGYNGHIIKLI